MTASRSLGDLAAEVKVWLSDDPLHGVGARDAERLPDLVQRWVDELREHGRDGVLQAVDRSDAYVLSTLLNRVLNRIKSETGRAGIPIELLALENFAVFFALAQLKRGPCEVIRV